jgi:hypothetical protein
MSGALIMKRVTKRERVPFEWHAMMLLELALVLAIVDAAYLLGRTGSPATLLVAAAPSIAVLGLAVAALLIRWWWAPAAAVGLLWAAVVVGVAEVAVGIASCVLTVPVGAIVAGLVIRGDRPALTAQGRRWSWGWAALGIGAWAFGVLALRWAWLSASWVP